MGMTTSAITGDLTDLPANTQPVDEVKELKARIAELEKQLEELNSGGISGGNEEED